MRQKRTCLQGAVLVVSLLTASVASGAARVLVAAPTESPLVERIDKELAAVGLEPVRAKAPCSPATIAELATAQRAVAATCADEDVVVVWTVSGEFVRLEEMIRRTSTDPRDAMEVAVRVAEVTRASIQLAEEGIERADAPVPRARASDISIADDLFVPEPLQDVLGERVPAPGRAAGAAPPASDIRIRAAIGVARYAGRNIGSDSVDGIVAVAVFPRLIPWARLAVPLTSTGISTTLLPGNGQSNGGNYVVSKIAVGLAAVGFEVPFFAAKEAFSLRIGGGVGAYWFNVETAQFGSRPDRNVAIVPSPALVASVEPSLRIYGPLRVAGSATASAAMVPAKVRLTIDDVDIRDRVTGPAIFAVAGRVEVLTQ